MARIKPKERSAEEKLAIVLDYLRGTVAYELCRKHGISEGTLSKWKFRVLTAGASALTGKRMVTDPAQAENQQLKEALADAMVTIQILKKIQR